MPTRPLVPRIAVWLGWATGAGLLAYAAFVAEQAATQAPDSAAGAALVLVSVVLWGVGVLASARGLGRGRRWARSPLVMTYLLLLAVGWALARGSGAEVAVGVAVLALAVLGLVVMLAPSVGAQLR
ncbi:MAG TPA: hypothetical protein VMI11_00545 [Actinomycetes bacterium]|nr:hypothetical protein [Actinomycetes bacterium]